MSPRYVDAEAETKPYSRDRRAVIGWAGGIIGTALLSWGVWVTVSIFDARQTSAVITVQLAQIQMQLAQIQRDLRGDKVAWRGAP